MTIKASSSFPLFKTFIFSLAAFFFLACSSKKGETKEEQIDVSYADTASSGDSTINSIQGNISFSQLATTPHSVVLTGMPEHRLVTVYKSKKDGKPSVGKVYYRSYEEEGDLQDHQTHYMPGIDLIYGYNLLNVAHYNFSTEKTNFLFDHPVLVKSIYYPSFKQDSIDKKPVNRDYYLISVYDEDTNNDTLLNRRDLRKFYHFNSDGSNRTQIIPAGYSVVRSQYDPKNDVMYIFARQDANKNGKAEPKEPLHVFWISLKSPAQAKRLY